MINKILQSKGVANREMERKYLPVHMLKWDYLYAKSYDLRSLSTLKEFPILLYTLRIKGMHWPCSGCSSLEFWPASTLMNIYHVYINDRQF